MSDIDINKAIAAQYSGADLDAAARAHEVGGWSRETALEMAQAEGLALGEDHWAVIDLLRKTYVERGRMQHARFLAGLLNDAFADKGGSKYLYQLFPGGPVAQGSRLAGVPAPHDTQDLSFGSSF